MSNNFEPLSSEEKAAAAQNKKSDKDEGTAIFPVPGDIALVIPAHPLGTPAHVWKYQDAGGQLLFYVCRFVAPNGEKEDRPLSYRVYKDGSKRWAWKSLDKPRPLYGLDRLAARPDAPVLVCEGEKATDAAQKLFPEYVVVTSPNGAGSAHCADWSPVQGRKVSIWPDHDDDGRKYAETVANLINQINGME
jgi:hypothetical protein